MATKLTPAQRNHAIELYRGGASAGQLAERFGVSLGRMAVIIKESGATRTASESRALYFARGGKPSVVREDISTDEVLKRYAAGESANQIAKSLGTCHDAVRTRLQRAGAAYRGIAEAAPLRPYDKMFAATAKSRSRKVGFGEDIMADWLRERGEVPDKIGRAHV